MNLIGGSAQDSWEIGVFLDSHDDPEGVAQVVDAYKKLHHQCRLDHKRIAAKKTKKQRRKSTDLVGDLMADLAVADDTADDEPQQDEGTCIRCGEELPYNLEKPLCWSCYKTWARYEDPTYEENVCHRCAEEGRVSMAKPLCRPCYRETK